MKYTNILRDIIVLITLLHLLLGKQLYAQKIDTTIYLSSFVNVRDTSGFLYNLLREQPPGTVAGSSNKLLEIFSSRIILIDELLEDSINLKESEIPIFNLTLEGNLILEYSDFYKITGINSNIKPNVDTYFSLDENFLEAKRRSKLFLRTYKVSDYLILIFNIPTTNLQKFISQLREIPVKTKMVNVNIGFLINKNSEFGKLINKKGIKITK